MTKEVLRLSVLQTNEGKSFRNFFILSKRKSLINILVFIIMQLAIWHGGLAEVIPVALLDMWNPLQMGSTVLLVVIFLANNRIPNKVSAILISMKVLVSVVAILNMHIVDVVEICRYIALILAIDFFYEEFDQLIKIFMLILEFLVYYNLIDLLNTQKDIYGVFYSALGYDNDFTKYMLVAYFVAMLYSLVTGKKIRSICLIVGVHITLFYAGVGTGMVSLIIMDILLLGRSLRLFNVTILQTFILYLIAEISIVFLKVQNLFSFIIVDLLGKDLTFTGRTNLWDNAIQKILVHPIIGYGDMDQLTEHLVLGDVYCHNGFLELLFRGGGIQLVMFIMLIIILDKATKRYFDPKTISICAVAFSGIWVTSITESIYQYGITMAIPALVYCAYKYVQTSMHNETRYIQDERKKGKCNGKKLFKN